MRWQNILSGILGLWIILVVIMGFSSTLSGFFLVVTGLALAVLGFWSASLTKAKQVRPPEKSENEVRPADNNGL